jgi:hypothetical protein
MIPYWLLDEEISFDNEISFDSEISSDKKETEAPVGVNWRPSLRPCQASRVRVGVPLECRPGFQALKNSGRLFGKKKCSEFLSRFWRALPSGARFFYASASCPPHAQHTEGVSEKSAVLDVSVPAHGAVIVAEGLVAAVAVGHAGLVTARFGTVRYWFS